MQTGREPAGLTGLVVVDKEPGWTSHDVVARCRRLFGQRRVGHAGTLDPDASGLLLVGLGRFTRMLRFVQGLQKSYVGEVVLGTSTSTLDASGEVTGTWDMSGVTIEDARAAAKHLTGRIEQIPPMVSAIKVGGTRLHALARQGVEIERAPREVTVERFEITELIDPTVGQSEASPGGLSEASQDRPRVLRIEVDCATGTYVRSLAADLGDLLCGGAHLRNLRRTKVGSFGLSEAHRLEELAPEHVLTPAQGLRDLQRLEVSSETARRVSHGLPVERASLIFAGGDSAGAADPSGAGAESGASGPSGVAGPAGGAGPSGGSGSPGVAGLSGVAGPFAVVDRSGRLLAVYESSGPDRIVAACVLAS
jgi:tRNA pseudouridine55 synthase